MKIQKKEIARWRNRIDKIDRDIIILLNKRAVCVDKIGCVKKRIGINVYSPKREKEVLKKISALNQGPFSRRAVRRIFTCIMLESRNFEHVKLRNKSKKRSN